MESDEIFEKGCALFDGAEYFEAHEVWEDLWNEARGPRHAYLQGLIQVAAAMHHAGNANWAGTRKLLASAMNYLQKGQGGGDEVNVEQLIDLMVDFELAIQRLLKGETVELPYFKLPRNR